jgi:hypothetical protein
LQPPSSFLSEAVAHMQKMLAGGNDAVYSFRELIMLLLRKTILDHRSFVSVQSVDWKTAFVIAPPPRNPADFATAAEGSELYSSLKLTNGYFLDLHYTVFIDSKDKYLKVDSSRMVYQSDDAGRDQFFRFEMDRKPKTHYPFAHLHVNGNWKPGPLKDLKTWRRFISLSPDQPSRISSEYLFTILGLSHSQSQVFSNLYCVLVNKNF